MTHSPLPTARTWGFQDQTDKIVPHSPMPWINYDDGPPGESGQKRRHQIACHGRTIAYVYETKGLEAEDRANALLMTCSPSMYRVCKLMTEAASIMNDGPDDSDRTQAVLYMEEAMRLATQNVKIIEGPFPK